MMPPPTNSLSPIGANTGVHAFHVVPTSQTCNLGTEERNEARTVNFGLGQAEITKANKSGSTIKKPV